MTSFRDPIPDFQLANPIYTGASVSFYTIDEDGAKTATLATLYAAPTGTQTTGNPQTLDSEGKFLSPVYIAEPVIAEVVGPNVESHDTGVIAARGRWRGEWVTGTRYFTEDFVTDPDTPHTIYVVTQDYTAGATFAGDVTDGNIELRVTGGDTYYFTVDDPGKPVAGETWRQLISEESVILEDFPFSFANLRVATTATTVFSIRKDNVQFATLTFAAGHTDGVFASSADTEFEPTPTVPVELAIVAPAQDATLSGLCVTIRLHRTPS